MKTEYLAGLFDGEGCIHIATQPIRATGNISYSLRVIFCLTHEPIIRAIAEQFAVSYCCLNKKRSNVKWRDAFQTQICGEKAAQLLRDMLPDLIVKREEAILAIKLQDHVTRYRNSSKRWTAEDRAAFMDFREGLKLQIKALKKLSGAPDGMMANSEKLPCPASNGAEGQPRAKQTSLSLVRRV